MDSRDMRFHRMVNLRRCWSVRVPCRCCQHLTMMGLCCRPHLQLLTEGLQVSVWLLVEQP
jgi:hypothetical protein